MRAFAHQVQSFGAAPSLDRLIWERARMAPACAPGRRRPDVSSESVQDEERTPVWLLVS